MSESSPKQPRSAGRSKSAAQDGALPAAPTTSTLVGRAPHNLDAERAVLGAMMLDNEIIPEVVQNVRAADFYHRPHQVIFEVITSLADRGQPVELTLVVEELSRRSQLDEAGGALGVATLESSVLSTGAAPELAVVVAEKATLRKLMGAAETILRESAEEKRDVAMMIDVAEKLIFDISQQTQSGAFVSVGELMPEAIAEIGKLTENRGSITGLATGFVDLDRLLNGLQKSDLLILAARPSIGKTAFALNIMMNISTKLRVPTAIFSLEMGKEQLNRRLLCSYAQIPGHMVQRGMISNSDFSLLKQKADELSTCPLFIDDTPGISLMQLRSRARRLAAQHPDLGLIVVDYLQLMSAGDKPSRDQNRQQEVSEISRGLKALARELRVPVVALSQLSRNIEQRSGKEKGARPMLSDLRESGAIEQDADIVMFVHRERVEVAQDEEGKPVDRSLPIETEIIVGKHRNGPIGSVNLLFWGDFTKFTNLAK